MKKDEIIRTIESLPTDIDGFKLYIYESRILEPWGLICTQGKLDKTKLLDIFDSVDEIKHYYFDNKLEFQFVVVYEKNEQFLFSETCSGSLSDCLAAVMTRITEHKNKNH